MIASPPLHELHPTLAVVLRERLQGKPESIPCGIEGHPERHVDTGMLRHHSIRYTPCEICAKEGQSFRKSDRLGIPRRLHEAKVATYEATGEPQERVRASVKGWILNHRENAPERKTFLILCGTPGTGKSHLAAAAIKALGGGWFVTSTDLFAKISASYTGDVGDPIKRARNARCLVVDEIAVGGDRADAPDTWNGILSYRHDRRLPTVITSNMGLKPILERIALAGIYDRIKSDSTILAFDWESNRTL